MSLTDILQIVQNNQQLFQERWHEFFSHKIEPLAVEVAFTDTMLRVVLADGREISSPLRGFRDY